MSARSVYIIGNGFDLHYGLPTRFLDFRKSVSARRPNLRAQVEKYLCDLGGNWANLEEALASFDVGQLVDHASNFLVPYSAENWSDSYHHDYQYEINEVVSAISRQLKEEFYFWIQKIQISSNPSGMRLSVEPDSCFLSFNYTPTLQKIYSVDQSRILHIHGSVEDGEDGIILGHGWNASGRARLNEGQEPQLVDTRVMEGNVLVERYFENTFKPTEEIIKRNQNFFSDIASVSDVYVWGHSLSTVDLPYFHEVVSAIKTKGPVWHVSHYCSSSVPGNTAAMSEIGVDISKVHHHILTEYIV